MNETPPSGATLHLGGQAWAHPSLEPRLRPINTVTPYPGNPRRGDQDAITASIRDLGLYTGVTTQAETGHILVGNHRRHALIELGATLIPADDLDVPDRVAAAIVARDNLTSNRGTDDPAELLALLTGDPEVLALSGYAEAELDALHRILANLEFAATADEVLGVPVGDLAAPIDLDGDAEKVTVTLDPGNRPALYALLEKLPYVRNVTNAHVRQPADA